MRRFGDSGICSMKMKFESSQILLWWTTMRRDHSVKLFLVDKIKYLHMSSAFFFFYEKSRPLHDECSLSLEQNINWFLV